MKTMKHLLLSIAICIGIASVAGAQVLTPNGNRSDQINLKMHEVDMLIQIMPLLLTKDQFPKILTAIEKNREILRKELQYEDDELAKLEPLLDDAMKGAYEKGAYPPRKMSDTVADKTAKLSLQRRIIVAMMIHNMSDVLDTTLNVGQKKAIIGSFDPKFIDPSAKPDSMSDDRKTSFFIERVFLDPITYEILKKLDK